MFIASSKGNARFCTWSEMPTKRVYKIGLLQKADPYSSREIIAQAYSKGIAWRIYHDLLNIYDAESLAVW